MSSPPEPVVRATPWQRRLEEYCRTNSLPAPQYHLFSDRRGGRTAWTTSVSVGQTVINARFFYDGQNIENSREDAAECALQNFGVIASPPQVQQQQFQQQNGGQFQQSNNGQFQVQG